jgi:hypothetical protein
MKKQRRDVDTFSLSFLDCICCGFGAIILLLVLTKIYEPIRLEESHEDLQRVIQRLQEELFEIRGETQVVNRELNSVEEQVSDEKLRLARLQGDLSRIRGEFATSRDDAEINSELAGQLAQARQSLTEEMQRLLRDYRPPVDKNMVGGIPVDSEYIIFIIDTSGSMYNYSWDRAQQKLRETLEVYPQVKGIQIMNDMGEYMFSNYRGKWIPDTPGRRKVIVDRMRSWNVFSNSSPVEGITKAIDTFYDPAKKISLYVFGDEFSGGSIEAVVRRVERINKVDDQGNTRVRIHAVGFPVIYEVTGSVQQTGERFASLMRVLCQRNGGTFVALPPRRAT